MSYCRWSTDDFQCDLYIYEDASGGWTTHVAGNRVVWHDGALPPPAPEGTPEWIDRYVEVMRLLGDPLKDAEGNENFHREPINMLFDGETFNDPTPGACADRVEELVSLGYRCPSEVVTELRAEQTELDREPDPDEHYDPDWQDPITRPSTMFERPPGNVYEVPEGSLDD